MNLKSMKIYQELLDSANKTGYYNQNERILTKAMVALVKSGHATFLFLQDDESRNWWAEKVKKAAVTVVKRKEARRKYELKLQAYNRLSDSERKLLKLTKPREPKS